MKPSWITALVEFERRIRANVRTRPDSEFQQSLRDQPTSNLDDLRTVQLKNMFRDATNGSAWHDDSFSHFKVLCPTVTARMKEANDAACLNVNRSEIGPLVTVAIHAGEREVFEFGWAAML